MTLLSLYINSFIDPNDFEKNNEKSPLSGGFGEVSFVTHKKTNIKCVSKKIKLDDQNFHHSFKVEIQNLAKYSHPIIVPFFGYYTDSTHGYIYLKEIENGSIAKHIFDDKATHPVFTQTQKYIICYGIALAMQYLHSNGCIHRDLKVENVLLDNNFYPFVTDFGSSKDTLRNCDLVFSSHPGIAPKIQAPEIIDDDGNTYYNTLPIDVYAYGVTLYEIWTESRFMKRYKGIFSVLKAVVNGERDEIQNNVPKEWKEMIEKCWEQDPEKRPTFDDIVEKIKSKTFLTKNIKQSDVSNYIKKIEERSKTLVGLLRKLNNETLAKIRPNESSKSLEDLYKYIIVQGSGIFGRTDNYDIYQFSLNYLNIIGENYQNFNNDKLLKKISNIELFLGKSMASLGYYSHCDNFLRRSLNHGNSMSAFYLAELISCKLIKESKKNEMIILYELASKKGVVEAHKKMPFIQYNQFLFNRKEDEQMNNYIIGIKKKYGIDTNKDMNKSLDYLIKSNYGPALIEVALQLFNDKQLVKLQKCFQKAADLNYPEGKFYCSIFLKKNNKDYLSYLKDAVIHQIPDAISFYGCYLMKINKITLGIRYLSRAADLGSMSAMIELGDFWEEKLESADSDSYFEKAANCCHSLDSFGFFTPISYKIYECKTCNKKICQGCAKHCHKGHQIVEIGEKCCFKCDCGSRGFIRKCSKM